MVCFGKSKLKFDYFYMLFLIRASSQLGVQRCTFVLDFTSFYEKKTDYFLNTAKILTVRQLLKLVGY